MTTATDVENQDLLLKEKEGTDSEEVEVTAAAAAAAASDKKQPMVVTQMDSGDIRDPHVAVHGLGKKIEADAPDEDDPDALPLLTKMMSMLWLFVKVSSALLLVVYLLAAFIIDFKRATALFTITVIVVVYNIYAWWASKNEEKMARTEDAIIEFMKKTDTEWKTAVMFTGTLVLIMVIIMAITVRDARNLVSLFGMLVFLGLTWLFSWKPQKVKIRPVIGSIFIQFIFGYIVIRTTWGLATMEFLADIFTTLLSYTVAGSSFVFAWLTDGSLFGRPFQLAPDAEGNDMGVYFLAPPFFFNVLPTVIFFSSLMSIGYYIRALPWLVRKLGT
jgi:hypothetical protein